MNEQKSTNKLNKRVLSFERTNARYLTSKIINENVAWLDNNQMASKEEYESRMNEFQERITIANQGNHSPNLIAIPDFFSTFLGYKYLDDPESIIYHYPFYLWFCSLIFLLIGCIYSIRKKEFFALFFLVLLVVTSLFYSFSGSHIYTRSGVFLMPFFIIFQASGTVVFIQSILNRLSNKDALQKKQYWILSGLVLFYFLTLHAGKLHNLDAVSGNP